MIRLFDTSFEYCERFLLCNKDTMLWWKEEGYNALLLFPIHALGLHLMFALVYL